MKFQPERFASAITGYGPGWIAIGGERFSNSLVLESSGQRTDWPCQRFGDLTPAHFASLVPLRPELVVFGSGDALRFPRPEWTRSLIEAGIGLEAMDTAAACRTYNILASEGRRVVAALLVESGAKKADELK